MPCTALLYQESKSVVPFTDWLATLLRPSKKQNLKAAARVKSLVDMLGREGHALRRPTAARLAGGIYELRARVGTVNYRVLYSSLVPALLYLLSVARRKGRATPLIFPR